MKQMLSICRLPRLSPREHDCLYWAAQGKTAEETALILELKTSTIVTYLKKIRHKLNAANLVNAVFKASQMKLFKSE